MIHNSLLATRRGSEAGSSFLLLACILVLAAFLRLYQLDLVDVRFDEASIPQAALAVSRGQWLAVVPFSGSVLNHPALFLYVLAVPYLFTQDFLAVVAFRVVLDVAAIGLTWAMCRRYFNIRIAHWAGLFFAVAPWAVQTARKTSGEALPLFSVILLWGLLEICVAKRPMGWVGVGLGVALGVGTHLSAAFLLPVVLVCAVVCHRTLQWRPVLMGLVPCLMLVAVYIGHDATVGFVNLKAVAAALWPGVSLPIPAPQWTTQAIQLALWLSGGAHLSDLTGNAFNLWQMQLPQAWAWIDWGQIVVLLLGLTLCGLKLARTRQPVYLLLLAWFVLPVVLQLRHARPLQLHYFLPLYPVPFVLMALAANEALEMLAAQRVSKLLVGSVLGIILGWQVFTTVRFYDFVSRYDTSLGGYGLPIRNSLAIVQTTHAPNTIVVTPGGDPLVNEMATVFDVLLAGQPHRFANANEGLILCEQPARYIFTPGTDEAYARLLRYAQVTLTQTMPLRAGSSQHYIVVETQGVNLAQMQFSPAQPWQNGAQLLGFQTQTPIQTQLIVETLIKVWRSAPAGDDYHWYHHLYRANEKIGQVDIGGVAARNWRAGDILLHWVSLPLPSELLGEAQGLGVRVGSYTYPQPATGDAGGRGGECDG